MSRTYPLDDAVPRGMVFAGTGTRDHANAHNQLIRLRDSLKLGALSAGANCVFGVEVKLTDVGNRSDNVVGYATGDAYRLSTKI